MKDVAKVEFVLDCSITISWFFEDEQSKYADETRLLLESTKGIVPEIWRQEIANTLVMSERRKRITAQILIGIFERHSRPSYFY